MDLAAQYTVSPSRAGFSSSPPVACEGGVMNVESGQFYRDTER